MKLNGFQSFRSRDFLRISGSPLTNKAPEATELKENTGIYASNTKFTSFSSQFSQNSAAPVRRPKFPFPSS
jgi:hypothetical protein